MSGRHLRIPAVFLLLAITLSAACDDFRIDKLVGDPLSPEVHRADIVALDAVLFEDGGLSDAGRKEVEKRLQALSVVAAKDPANTIAVRLGKDLKILAAGAARTPVGTTLLNSQLRYQWLRIRSSLFDDAWWFRRSSADPIEPEVPGPPPPSALRPPTDDERRGLSQALLSLGGLIDKARRDLSNEYESEAHREFVTEAERELGLDVERLGSKPPAYGIDVFYQDAHRWALEAVRVLKSADRARHRRAGVEPCLPHQEGPGLPPEGPGRRRRNPLGPVLRVRRRSRRARYLTAKAVEASQSRYRLRCPSPCR